MEYNKGLMLYKNSRAAKGALRRFLREATKKGVESWSTSNQPNSWDGSYADYYCCAYCGGIKFKLININGTEIIEQIMPRESVYKTSPDGVKDLKIIEQYGNPGGWVAGIGPHDVVCCKCNKLIEHRGFYYLQYEPSVRKGMYAERYSR